MAAGWLIVQGLGALTVVVMPVVIALFLAALAVPAVHLLTRLMPRGVAALIVLVGVLAAVGRRAEAEERERRSQVDTFVELLLDRPRDVESRPMRAARRRA